MSLVKLAEDIRACLVPIVQMLVDVQRKFQEFIIENPDFLENLKFYFENMPNVHSKIWQDGAANGWFVNWYTTLAFDTAVLSGKEELDKYMQLHIENHIKGIEEKLIALYPEREHIFKAAFSLHHSENYVAAIPLFISQSDGICAQSIGAYLFTEHEKRSEKIRELLENHPEEMEKVFFSPLLAQTQFSAGIGSCSAINKEKAPNRSGIMHGSRKHLDYGTKINSLKSISLLAYSAYIFERKTA